jgi:hypothetical protein
MNPDPNAARRRNAAMDTFYRLDETSKRVPRTQEMRQNNQSDDQIQSILVERMSNLNFLLDILLRRREHKRRLDTARRTREPGETDDQYIARLQYFIRECDRLIFEQIRNLDTPQDQGHLQTLQRSLQALGRLREAHETNQTYISRLEAYVHECGIVYSFLYEMNEELEKKVQVFESLRTKMFDNEGRIRENISEEENNNYKDNIDVILGTISNYTRERDALQRQRHAQAFGMSPRRIKCKTNQTRNRSTGRCRKTPCRSGKKRDVNTGRCQKKKSSGRKSPKRKSRIMKVPCRPDQVRNRSTGRCQKKS